MAEEPWEIFEVTLERELRSAGQDQRLRARATDNNIAEANDLQFYPVTNASKQWACEAIDGMHLDHPAWQRLGIKAGTRLSRIQFRELFGLTRHQMQHWFDCYKQNRFSDNPEEVMQAGAGSKIDAIAMKDVIAHARGLLPDGPRNGRAARKRKNLGEMAPVFKKAVADTAERRGASAMEIEAAAPISVSTIRRYKLRESLGERKPQPQTEARKKALADPFLLISWVVMMVAFFGVLCAFKKFNIDFSMVKVLPPGAGQRVFFCREEEAEAEEAGLRFILEQNNNDGNGNAMFAKYAMMSEFNGLFAPLLAIFQCDGMPADGCHVGRIPGLSASNEIAAYGYIMILPKRAGNAVSNKWIHEDYIIKYISESDKRSADLEGGGQRSCIYFDSEHGPLEAGMQPGTLAKYREHDIAALRGMVSGTSRHQLMDDIPLFRVVHQTAASVARNGVDVQHELMRKGLSIEFAKLKQNYPEAKATKSWCEKATHAAEVLAYSAQKGSAAEAVRESGIRIGQHVRVGDTPKYQHPGYEKTTVDVHKIMTRCTTDFTNEEVENILTNLPEMVDTAHNKGRITQKQMAELTGIDPTPYTDRDGKSLDQSYPTCITNPNEEDRWRQ